MACHHWGPVSGLHQQPPKPQELPKKKKKKKKEGIATRHHTLLLSLPWEHTCPAGATAKQSGWHRDTWSLSLPKTPQLGADLLYGLQAAGANCHSYS